jgi:hypothetical protein
MNLLYNNKIQKLSATLLLFVLVFINTVKTFHTHDFLYSTQTKNLNKDAATVKTVFSCVICDFQIAKDSDAQVALINIATPINYITAFYTYTLPSLSSFAVISSVRGPPVFIA